MLQPQRFEVTCWISGWKCVAERSSLSRCLCSIRMFMTLMKWMVTYSQNHDFQPNICYLNNLNKNIQQSQSWQYIHAADPFVEMSQTCYRKACCLKDDSLIVGYFSDCSCHVLDSIGFTQRFYNGSLLDTTSTQVWNIQSNMHAWIFCWAVSTCVCMYLNISKCIYMYLNVSKYT